MTAFVGLGLLEWSTWRRLPRMNRVDAAAFLITTGATLFGNAFIAVALGCSLSSPATSTGNWWEPPPSQPRRRESHCLSN